MFSVQRRFIAIKQKKEIFPFSLFKMHVGTSIVYSAFVVFWPHKHNRIYFSIQRRCIANKEKGDVSFFNFPNSICMAVHQWYILRLSSFGLTSIMVYDFLFNTVS